MEEIEHCSEIVNDIKLGKLFIYPTDTIYGIGCNALNGESVNMIKEIKKREADKPLSVIAPSFEWIEENLIVDVDLKKYLPGAYTLILKKKNENFLSEISSGEYLGVRIPDCNFSLFVRESQVPFITTSVNFSGEKFALGVEEIDSEILKKIDIIIDEGKLDGKPSTLVKGGVEIERN
jgi:L-threonylcarbamoyladenylate synthase